MLDSATTVISIVTIKEERVNSIAAFHPWRNIWEPLSDLFKHDSSVYTIEGIFEIEKKDPFRRVRNIRE